MLGPGTVLGDRYRLDEHLATGGMGEVWRGTDVVLRRAVAVKVLLPSLLADPDFGARFAAEARTMAALHHPGVVDVYDYADGDLPDGTRVAYLVMEYVAGESLAERLADVDRLDVATTMSIVAQVADALDAAHAGGVVHRDVKPGNLRIKPDGTVLLLDFGVARSSATPTVTGTNTVVGTAAYMAPEQAAGRPVSPATDIYALGAVAYHCLAGRPPFTGRTPLEVAMRHLHDEPTALPTDIPPPVAALVARALAKDPAERFPSAGALASAARAVRGGPPPPVAAVRHAGPDTLTDLPAVGPPSRRSVGRKRRTTIAGAVAAIALGLIGLVAALAFAPGAGPQPGTGRLPSPGPTATTGSGRSPVGDRDVTAPTSTTRPATRQSTGGRDEGARTPASTPATGRSSPAGTPTPDTSTPPTTDPTPSGGVGGSKEPVRGGQR